MWDCEFFRNMKVPHTYALVGIRVRTRIVLRNYLVIYFGFHSYDISFEAKTNETGMMSGTSLPRETQMRGPGGDFP